MVDDRTSTAIANVNTVRHTACAFGLKIPVELTASSRMKLSWVSRLNCSTIRALYLGP